MAVVPVASAHASSSANWQAGFSGTGTLAGNGFGFWGWCQFFGVSSGNDGDCSVSQYLHTSGGNIQCETDIQVADWVIGSTPFSLGADFLITAGNVVVHPAAQTWACAAFLSGAGFNLTPVAPGLLVVSGVSDSGVPAAAGHYSFNGLTEGPIVFNEFQIQVSQHP